ncbi:MAG: hypothetical protein DMG72_06375 [Acidobacteria bacterium]|nr:MAG: hypothetical protein DMG72_06375 [Acidobacteriota bacterium]
MQALIVHLQPLPARYGIPSDSLSEWLPNAFEAIWIFRPMYLWWIIGVLEKGKTPASWIAPQWLWAVENVAQLHAGDHPIATKMLLDLISASVERKLIEGQGGRDEVMSQAYLPIISAYDEGEMKSTKSASSGLDLDEAMSSGRPESKTKQPRAVERGQICVQLKDEIKRVRYMTREGGKNIDEIKADTPNFLIWKVAESEQLSKEDREMLLHPNQWATGYAALLLSKYFGVSLSRIRDYITNYNRTTKTPA